MKKVLLSLISAIVCLPMALGQATDGVTVVTTTKTACHEFTWNISNETYTHDTIVSRVVNDTVYVLDFTLASASVDTANAIELNGVCGVKWNGTVWTTAGTFIDTLQTAAGCDSIVKVNITLQEVGGILYDTLDETACGRYIAPWGDTLTVSGTYDTLAADTLNYCTTMTHLILTVNPSYTDVAATDTADITTGCYYTFNGVTYTDTNIVHTVTLKTAANCDSVVNFRIVSYTGSQYDTLKVQGCGSYKWNANNVTYTTAGNYNDTTYTEDSICAIYTTLSLTFGDAYDTITASRCAEYSRSFYSRVGDELHPYTFTVTQSGTYITDTNYIDTIHPEFADANLYSIDGLNGCITHHTLIANIVQPEQRVNDVIDTTACDKYTFKVGTRSVLLTDDADTTLVYSRHVSTTQCYDEIGRIIFHVLRSTYMETTVTACDSYTWTEFNGMTYTRSTTVEEHIKDTNYVVVDSTVVYDSIGDSNIVTYEYDTEIVNRTNSVGCDSIGRLRLTINNSPDVTIAGEWMLEPGESTTLRAVCSNFRNNRLSFKWYKDGVLSGTDSTLVVEAPGNMNENSNIEVRLVTTTNKNCSSTNWITITSNDMGIEGIEAVNVDIYPNPAARIVNLNSDEALSEIAIYNIMGQQVMLQHVDGHQAQLDLGNLANGQFTLRITAASGEQTTRKLIVNK